MGSPLFRNNINPNQELIENLSKAEFITKTQSALSSFFGVQFSPYQSRSSWFFPFLGSGPEGVDDLSFQIYGEFSPSSTPLPVSSPSLTLEY